MSEVMESNSGAMAGEEGLDAAAGARKAETTDVAPVGAAVAQAGAVDDAGAAEAPAGAAEQPAVKRVRAKTQGGRRVAANETRDAAAGEAAAANGEDEAKPQAPSKATKPAKQAKFAKSAKQAKPAKSAKQAKPAESVKQAKAVKPAKQAKPPKQKATTVEFRCGRDELDALRTLRRQLGTAGGKVRKSALLRVAMGLLGQQGEAQLAGLLDGLPRLAKR